MKHPLPLPINIVHPVEGKADRKTKDETLFYVQPFNHKFMYNNNSKMEIKHSSKSNSAESAEMFFSLNSLISSFQDKTMLQRNTYVLKNIFTFFQA